MTTRATAKGLARVALAMLTLLFGLCTIFVLVVTVAEAWQEHAQARWPEVAAHVDRCGLTQTSTGQRNRLYIRCRLSYAVGDELHTATVYSRTVPSPDVWQYPRNQMDPFSEWVDEHPPGTPVLLRYNPANHAKIVVAASFMPGGGPHTPNNIKLLQFFAGGFLVLLIIAKIVRPRPPQPNAYSSAPLNP